MKREFEQLQEEHLALLAQYEATDGKQPGVEKARAYIKRGRSLAKHIASPRERNQIRANLNFWASYVYDRAGEMPDTRLEPYVGPRRSYASGEESLMEPEGYGLVVNEAMEGDRPLQAAEEGGEASTAGGRGVSQGWYERTGEQWWLWAVGGLTVIVLLALAVRSLLTPTPLPGKPTFTPSPRPSPTPTTTPIRWEATATAMAAVAVRLEATATAAAATLTALASATPDVSIGTPTLTPKPTPTFPFPYRRLQLIAMAEYEGGCEHRSLEVHFARDVRRSLPPLVTVRLRESGTGATVAEAALSRDTEEVSFDLDRLGRRRDATYLLQVVAPNVTTWNVIVQYTADCRYNQAQVVYTLRDMPSVIDKPLTAQGLELDWMLLTWGPSPFGEAWTAQLRLQATGGDGHYVYWAAGEPLERDLLVMEGRACEPARIAVGVTSGGERVLRELVLLSPFCP